MKVAVYFPFDEEDAEDFFEPQIHEHLSMFKFEEEKLLRRMERSPLWDVIQDQNIEWEYNPSFFRTINVTVDSKQLFRLKLSASVETFRRTDLTIDEMNARIRGEWDD